MTLAIILVILNILLLGYFLYFAFYNYLYTIASFFYKPPKRVEKLSGKRVAIVKVSFNEKTVLRKTLENCEKITYPNKMIIAADDSNDGETYPDIVEWVKEHNGKELSERQAKKYHPDCNIWSSPKKDFMIIHRNTNEGYKAGNMRLIQKYLRANGVQYMYLLDADWTPDPDVIDEALAVLEADESLAFVQTRREHYNRLQGVFQHATSLSEEAGFEVEYPGRQVLGDPILFTGCCTLFRVEAIEDVGGFRAGHLTEDIDLTNRFYLRGWTAAYLPYVSNQGEVAPSYRSLIKQQDRWAMGTARTLKEFYRKVLKSVHLNWRQRISLLRQNMYYSTAIAIEMSLFSAIISVSWIAFFPESYGANLYLLYMGQIGTIYTLLIFIALMSNFVPVLLAVIKRGHFKEIPYILFTSWLFWSLLHTYFWANIKAFFNFKTTWFKTPKTDGKKIVDTTAFSKRRLVLNGFTLALFIGIYITEFYIYGGVSPYAYFWIPAMTVGMFVA